MIRSKYITKAFFLLISYLNYHLFDWICWTKRNFKHFLAFFYWENLHLKSSNWLWNMGSFWMVTIFVCCIIYSISLAVISNIWIWPADHLCWFVIFNHHLCMLLTFLPIGCLVTVIKRDKRNYCFQKFHNSKPEKFIQLPAIDKQFCDFVCVCLFLFSNFSTHKWLLCFQ